jgi:hypothetical protein
MLQSCQYRPKGGDFAVNPQKLKLLVALDLVFLLLVLLFMSFYGISHLFLLGLGAILFLASLLDCRTGRFSQMTELLFGLKSSAEQGRFNWLPVFLSAVLLVYQGYLFLEYGPVNTMQRMAMQEGYFPRLVLWSGIATLLVIIVAVGSIRPER